LIIPLASMILPIAVLVTAIPSARAQDYPSLAVEVVVPFPAGGGAEIVTRHLSDGLTRRLGQAFVVLNRPGANTNLATLAVIRSKPDGYTLLIASFGLAANPSLYKRLGFEPQSDLEPIILIANSPTVLVVPASLPASTLAEFTAYVQARPGGSASPPTASAAAISAPGCSRADRHQRWCVPMAAGPAAVDVMTNQLQALSPAWCRCSASRRHLRAIAIAADLRSGSFPTCRPSRSRAWTTRPAPGTA
jgi:tripartite-type tricarboxylate transporter receptor subunit TctC